MFKLVTRRYHYETCGLYFKSITIAFYNRNVTIVDNLYVIIANLALARSINYNHKGCKLKSTFTIVNYDPKPFIVKASYRVNKSFIIRCLRVSLRAKYMLHRLTPDSGKLFYLVLLAKLASTFLMWPSTLSQSTETTNLLLVLPKKPRSIMARATS
jgi:hypothetical protein